MTAPPNGDPSLAFIFDRLRGAILEKLAGLVMTRETRVGLQNAIWKVCDEAQEAVTRITAPAESPDTSVREALAELHARLVEVWAHSDAYNEERGITRTPEMQRMYLRAKAALKLSNRALSTPVAPAPELPTLTDDEIISAIDESGLVCGNIPLAFELVRIGAALASPAPEPVTRLSAEYWRARAEAAEESEQWLQDATAARSQPAPEPARQQGWRSSVKEWNEGNGFAREVAEQATEPADPCDFIGHAALTATNPAFCQHPSWKDAPQGKKQCEVCGAIGSEWRVFRPEQAPDAPSEPVVPAVGTIGRWRVGAELVEGTIERQTIGGRDSCINGTWYFTSDLRPADAPSEPVGTRQHLSRLFRCGDDADWPTIIRVAEIAVGALAARGALQTGAGWTAPPLQGDGPVNPPKT